MEGGRRHVLRGHWATSRAAAMPRVPLYDTLPVVELSHPFESD